MYIDKTESEGFLYLPFYTFDDLDDKSDDLTTSNTLTILDLVVIEILPLGSTYMPATL